MIPMFEPDILGFACNWCGYAGADQAGLLKYQYPSNLKIVRVMCLGSLDPRLIYKAFETGYDGVLLTGCHEGDCHYISGNLQAFKEADKIKNNLEILGLGKERLRVEEISSAEGAKFQQVVTDFIEEIKKLGPNPTTPIPTLYPPTRWD